MATCGYCTKQHSSKHGQGKSSLSVHHSCLLLLLSLCLPSYKTKMRQIRAVNPSLLLRTELSRKDIVKPSSGGFDNPTGTFHSSRDMFGNPAQEVCSLPAANPSQTPSKPQRSSESPTSRRRSSILGECARVFPNLHLNSGNLVLSRGIQWDLKGSQEQTPSIQDLSVRPASWDLERPSHTAAACTSGRY